MKLTKHIILGITTVLALSSCKQENNFVTLSGKITNKNSNNVFVMNPEIGYKKQITVNEDGTFKDTLTVKDGLYTFFDGVEYAGLFLQNGDNISISLDTRQFDETIKFTGKGSEESNFIANALLKREQFLADKELFDLPEDAFKTKVNAFVDEFKSQLAKNKLDATFRTSQNEEIEGIKNYLNKTYTDKRYMINTLSKGNPSPKFVNYENYKGGTTSLDDLKGKYVYIDIWATWCQPCKQEIPFLQKFEKEYQNKNIEFVSISVDQDEAHQVWKDMVKEKQMGGIQLFSKRDTTFLNGYRVNSIPRFILLDPKGNIVNANAPRPSQPELIDLFNSIKL